MCARWHRAATAAEDAICADECLFCLVICVCVWCSRHFPTGSVGLTGGSDDALLHTTARAPRYYTICSIYINSTYIVHTSTRSISGGYFAKPSAHSEHQCANQPPTGPRMLCTTLCESLALVERTTKPKGGTLA